MFLGCETELAAHRKLAELEDGRRINCCITQNIDGLHQAAGSKNSTGTARKYSSQLLHEMP